METKPKIQRFEDLIVWQKSMDLAEEIYKVTKQGEFAKDWGLKQQVQRAAVSVPANISEGFERYSNKEFRQYLLIAKGSAGEVRTHLYLARNLGYVTPIEADLLIKKCVDVSRLLGGLVRSVTENQ
jgi:four helix bundle protein